jgi:hypothetical protein
MNLVLRDFDETVRHFRDAYAAEFVADIPKAECHACLMATGGVLFELFHPSVWLFNARYGPHFVGVEYQADMEVVSRAVAERQMRIVRESRYERDLAGNPGYALHTHPADGFGVSYEFYHDDFHQWVWPDLGSRVTPADASHPLGVTGQKGYTHAVHDIEGASAFLQSFLGAEPVYEAERRAIGARAVGLRIADVVVELLTPTGEGELARHLHRYGDGVHSIVFGVSDIDRTKASLAERGLATVAGGAPGVLAVPAQANLGVIFEFSE